jgi:hypothetical protein
MARRAVCLVALALLSGCVERRFVIESDPPGALVLLNGQPLGTTPVDGHFTYYGNYTFTLVKDGYQTKKVDQCFNTPWYEIPPIDFVTENLYPAKVEDVRRVSVTLEPIVQVNPQQLLTDADQLRNRGRAVQTPPE